MNIARLAVVAALAGVAACSNSYSPTGTASAPPPGAMVISIRDFTFSPANVTVKAGQIVVWRNDGPTAHTTTSNGGLWDSGTLSGPNGGSGGATYQRAFSTPGVYPYHCSIHPPALYPGFTGTITVTQ